MGKYSVPAHIRALKPEGTMVKAISGHWYVYEYENVKVGDKRMMRMGPCIGSIVEGEGFVGKQGVS